MEDTRIALCDARGPLTDLLEKLSGEEGGQWLGALNRMLRKENPWEFTARNFEAWKTIKLGLRKSPEEYREALKVSKYRIGDYASQILDKTPVSQEEVEVDLVCVTGHQLGFKGNTRRDVIYERALNLGLQKCSSEVGPALRGQYPDQPMSEWFLIGMDPITDSDGGLRVFRVEHDDRGLWLSSHYGYPGYVWNLDDQWVFVLPRK